MASARPDCSLVDAAGRVVVLQIDQGVQPGGLHPDAQLIKVEPARRMPVDLVELFLCCSEQVQARARLAVQTAGRRCIEERDRRLERRAELDEQPACPFQLLGCGRVAATAREMPAELEPGHGLAATVPTAVTGCRA